MKIETWIALTGIIGMLLTIISIDTKSSLLAIFGTIVSSIFVGSVFGYIDHATYKLEQEHKNSIERK